MNSKLTNFLMFTAGAAVGSVVTWKLIETKYSRLAQEEIESVKEVFSKKESEAEHEDEEPDQDIVTKNGYSDKPDLKDVYEKVLSGAGYTNYATASDHAEKEAEEKADDVERPYVITPEEFGEFEDYETISLVYFEDGVLTDDQYEPVDDVDDVVGYDSLDHFGEYEDDSVFVRNDARRTDYEILLDSRRYHKDINPDLHFDEEDE